MDRIRKMRKGGPQRKPTSIAKKAQLSFPVRRMQKQMRSQTNAKVTKAGAIAYAAAIEYLMAEVVELCGEKATAAKRKTVKPRDIQLAIRCDEELQKLVPNVTISMGGRSNLDPVHPALLKKKKE